MKTPFVAAAFVVGALLIPALGFAADDHDKDRTHATAFVKDSAITTKVKAKLAAEHMSSLGTIHVFVVVIGREAERGNEQRTDDECSGNKWGLHGISPGTWGM